MAAINQRLNTLINFFIPSPPPPSLPPLPRPPPSPPAFLQSLAVYYKFDNATNLGLDSGPDGNYTLYPTSLFTTYTPTYPQTLAYAAGGRFGGALAVLGCETMTTSAYSPRLPRGNSPYTISFWVNATPNLALNGGWIPFSLGRWICGGRSAIVGGIWNDGNISHTWICSDLGPYATPTGASVVDGKWHHVGLVYDGTLRSIYADFNLMAQDTPGVQAAVDPIPYIGIGNHNKDASSGAQCTLPPSGAFVWRGICYTCPDVTAYMDDFAVFSTALSTADLQTFGMQLYL